MSRAASAVPDVVFALIFVTAVGLGPFAGVLPLICHNTGVMGKLWAEAMEESDQGPVQELATTGASRLQQTFQATIPLVVPQFVGLHLYRFDVNVRSSLVLGLVGAGGAGLLKLQCGGLPAVLPWENVQTGAFACTPSLSG